MRVCACVHVCVRVCVCIHVWVCDNAVVLACVMHIYPPTRVLPLDLSDADVCSSATEKALELFGRVDILINNAGVYSLCVCVCVHFVCVFCVCVCVCVRVSCVFRHWYVM